MKAGFLAKPGLHAVPGVAKSGALSRTVPRVPGPQLRGNGSHDRRRPPAEPGPP